MEHRITVTVAESGYDEANGERALEAFLRTAPETGPVVSQDTSTGTLAVTFALDAADAQDAYHRAEPVIVDGFANARLDHPTELIGLEIRTVLDRDPAEDVVPA